MTTLFRRCKSGESNKEIMTRSHLSRISSKYTERLLSSNNEKFGYTYSESTRTRTLSLTDFQALATLTDRFGYTYSESTRTRTLTVSRTSKLWLPSPTDSATRIASPHVHEMSQSHGLPSSSYPHRQIRLHV